MFKKLLLLLALSVQIASPCKFCTRLLRNQAVADCCEGVGSISTSIGVCGIFVEGYKNNPDLPPCCSGTSILLFLLSGLVCTIASERIEANKINQGIPESEHHKTRNHFTESVRTLYAVNREVRDSAGEKENRPRFYNKGVLEKWRENCMESDRHHSDVRYYRVDPATGRHRINFYARTLSQSLKHWRQKNMPLAEFIEYLREKDVISEQGHIALWSDLIELGQEMGLSSNEIQGIMHTFPGKYKEVTTIIHEFEKVLDNNTAAPTPTAQDMMQ